jgi:hypothetical protein
MTESPGHNPIRWDCRNGCFNELMRPKIEAFAECFPRNIGMMDIDGTVELNGHFLFLEFKTSGCPDCLTWHVANGGKRST